MTLIAIGFIIGFITMMLAVATVIAVGRGMWQ